MAVALALLYPGCTISEIALAADRLVGHGHDVRWWTPDGAVVSDSAGLRIAPSVDMMADVVAASAGADVILVPGGDPESIVGDRTVAGAIGAADRRGAMIAAICAGVLVLADAGVVAGRRITHNYRRPLAPLEIEAFTERFWVDAVVEPDLDHGVVVDDNLITALPTAVLEFADIVVERVNRADRRDPDGS